jgi:hypothetical protein
MKGQSYTFSSPFRESAGVAAPLHYDNVAGGGSRSRFAIQWVRSEVHGLVQHLRTETSFEQPVGIKSADRAQRPVQRPVRPTRTTNQ